MFKGFNTPVTDHSLSLAITCWFCPGVLWLSWGSGEQTEGRLCQFLLSGIVNSLHRWWTASARGSVRLCCLQPPKGETEGDMIFSHNTARNMSVVSKLRQHGFTGSWVKKEESQQMTWKYLPVRHITKHLFTKESKLLMRKRIPEQMCFYQRLPTPSFSYFFSYMSKSPALLN